MMARFNDVIPNGADRIVVMAEKQQAHRHDLESAVVKGNVHAQALGQLYAFLLSLVTILGGIWLIGHDKTVSGLVAIIGALATLAGVFVYARVEQAREREQKRKEIREASQQPRLPLE
jgi:uncharacterized membrane protein